VREPKIWNQFLSAPHCLHVGAVQPLRVSVDARDELVRLLEDCPLLLFALVAGGLQLLLDVRDHLALQQL
jgi:hypothetical protein